MLDRRKTQRFAVTTPWEGKLRMLQDVTVRTNRATNEIVAITDAPVPAHEVLTLTAASHGEAGWNVWLIECRPMMWEGSVAYGLQLGVLGEATQCHTSLLDEGDAGDFFAVLRREVDIRLLNVSRSGCLLESPRDLCLGTTGEVWCSSERGGHRDDIRVIRCQPDRNSSSYLLGAEFLWTRFPTNGSLRDAIRIPWYKF